MRPYLRSAVGDGCSAAPITFGLPPHGDGWMIAPEMGGGQPLRATGVARPALWARCRG
jgi:hypothetical protein